MISTHLKSGVHITIQLFKEKYGADFMNSVSAWFILDDNVHGRMHADHFRPRQKGVGPETAPTRRSLLRAQAPLQSSSSQLGPYAHAHL